MLLILHLIWFACVWTWNNLKKKILIKNISEEVLLIPKPHTHTQIYHYDSDTNFWREGFLFKPGLKQNKLNKLFYSYQKKLYQYTGKIK